MDQSMPLERLVAALAPARVLREELVEISDLAYAAGVVRPGALFFCIPGSKADGHEFATAAVERGAVALVVERPVEAPVPQLVVADARAAMAVAADEFFSRPTEELEVAGITGTNGKTTTAFVLHSILDAAGRRPALVTTIETRVGAERHASVRTTPEAIDLQRLFRRMLAEGHRSCAMEATSHGSDLHRLDRVRFAVLVFTNLTQDHLDFHGTMESYYEAKRRLFGTAPAAVNVGDPWGRRLAEELRGGELLTFGFADDADVRPDALEGIDFPLPSRFNAENALAAIAAARLLGIEEEAVAAGLEATPQIPGRFESIDEGQAFRVVVDYSHKPDALEQVLTTAKSLGEGRLLCVFGCGGDRDHGKRPVMGRVASELADLAIVTSDNPRGENPEAIIEEILAGVVRDIVVEPDRRRAIERAVELARDGDVVVIAGKGHEQGQEIAGRTVPFDDRDIARQALRALGART